MPLIAFTSPKGGVGKTTLAAHVAALLAARGHRVLAIDLDPQNALRLHLGLSIRDESGFFATLGQSGEGSWRGAVRDTPSGVRLLPYGSVEPRRAMELGVSLLDTPDLLAAPVRDMLADPDLVVVLDSPPGPGAALNALLPLCDLILVVLLADAGSASLIPLVASGKSLGRGTLASRVADRAVLVLNQVDLDSPLSSTVLDCAAGVLGSRLLCAVCRDDTVGEALADKRLLLDGDGGAAEDLAVLTDAIAARLKLVPPGAKRGGYSALTDWGLR